MVSGPYLRTKHLMIVRSLLITFFSCLFLARAHPVQEKSLTVANNVYPRGSSQSTLKAAPHQLSIGVPISSKKLSEEEIQHILTLKVLEIHSVISDIESRLYSRQHPRYDKRMRSLDFAVMWHDPVTKKDTPAIARLHADNFKIKHAMDGYEKAELLLDVGHDASGHWWIILKDMTRDARHPALPIYEIIQIHGHKPTLSSCTSQVKQAEEVLTRQLKIYVEKKEMLPRFVSVHEMLFTFDPQSLVVDAATITFWEEWLPKKVWDEGDGDIQGVLWTVQSQLDGACSYHVECVPD